MLQTWEFLKLNQLIVLQHFETTLSKAVRFYSPHQFFFTFVYFKDICEYFVKFLKCPGGSKEHRNFHSCIRGLMVDKVTKWSDGTKATSTFQNASQAGFNAEIWQVNILFWMFVERDEVWENLLGRQALWRCYSYLDSNNRNSDKNLY